MADNPRTDAAREHDDSALIERAVAEANTAAIADAAGGMLPTEIGMQADLLRAADEVEDDDDRR